MKKGGLWSRITLEGTPKSTVEINDLTEDGSVFSNGYWFGRSVTSLGDMDGDGVTDIAVGVGWGEGEGAIHIIFLNSDGAPKSTVEINDSTAYGPNLSDLGGFGSSVTNLGGLDGAGTVDNSILDNDILCSLWCTCW